MARHERGRRHGTVLTGMAEAPRTTRADATATAGDGRGYRPIADYAIVGDAQSAALVASDGAIDWLCLPHFDSPAVLCRLLDANKGGYLSLQPAGTISGARRRYREASNVLETTLESPTGGVRLIDAMPVAEGDTTPPLDGVWGGRGRHRVIRLVEAAAEPVEVRLDARLAFDFAATPAAIAVEPGRGAIAHDGADRYLVLVWPGALAAVGAPTSGELRGSLTLPTGGAAACVLAFANTEREARALLAGEDWAAQVAETDAAWRRWSAGCTVDGPYADALLRSALVLKMLTFEPTGALIAAPTTSLPEAIGGVRNWDYRYCWLRDATFTLYALLLVGDRTAARSFWNWIERTCSCLTPDCVQIMYGIHGERDLPERTLDHLSGYRDSRPVRVGNAAARQAQLDVYGELLDAFWFFHRLAAEDGEPLPLDPEVSALLRGIADHICAVWREPDQGLWEVRGGPRHFVYSKVMCWVGLDRALRLAEREPDVFGGDTTRWAAERDAIRAEVLDRGYNPRIGAFTMAYGTEGLDAATLRMPLVGFLPADDPRMRSTIRQVQARLGVDGLLLRYHTGEADDGLPHGEGAFSICTFWLVDCLTALGEIDEARETFERMLGYASDLGLFAEEIDPATGAALGNYPQAFTHLALIDAGVDLTEALARRTALPGPTDERAKSVRRGRAARGETT